MEQYPQLAKAIRELDGLEEAKKEAAKEYGDEIKKLKERISRMAERALDEDDNEHLDFAERTEVHLGVALDE